MTVLAIGSVVLAVLGIILYVVSLRPSVVVGPPWAAVLVVIALGGGWAAVWLLAQATPAGTGWIVTTAVAAIAVVATFGGGPLAAAALRLTDPRPGVPQSAHAPDPIKPDAVERDVAHDDHESIADPASAEDLIGGAASVMSAVAPPVGISVATLLQRRPAMSASPATPDVLRGGALIGVLERACILSLLLVGYPEGIAVVLAIKGLGRFGELRIPAAPERFIVGTLASVLWSILGFAAIGAVLT